MPGHARETSWPAGRFRAVLELTVRPCEAHDLHKLEWFGQFTGHRVFIAAQFERHLRGENLMLVAAHRDFPVGQVWIDWTRSASASVASIWALRVMEPLQGLGIGGRLLAAAEDHARAARMHAAEIGVEKQATAVRSMYERLGYASSREEISQETYVAPDGTPHDYVYDLWILTKLLSPRCLAR